MRWEWPTTQKGLAIREKPGFAEPGNADLQRELSVSYNKIGQGPLSRSLGGALAILYLGVMNKSPRAKDFEAKPAPAGTGKIGVLLINLGTPDATTYWPMRRYLKEFLSDRRVIETNRALWWAILNSVVLVKRPVSSGAKYRSIWNEALDESPLRTITRAQAEKVSSAFAGRPGIVVDWAMRYGNPSIHERIDALVAQGCDRIVSFPLYPQYAAATTATANDKVFEALTKLRAQPALRTVPPYPADPVYIEALADSIRTHLAGLDFAPEAILASFHGLPQDYVDKGDPYQVQCAQTTEALRAALGPELGAKLKLTFQSRFGRAEWINPISASAWIRQMRCARRSARLARSSSSPSNRASGAPNGSSLIPTRRWRLWRATVSSPSPSSRRASPPIASRRSKRSPTRTGRSSSSMAASASPTSRASTTARAGSPCSCI